MGTRVFHRARWEGPAAIRRTRRLTVASVTLAFATVILISGVEPMASSAADEAHHDDYRLDDRDMVFLSRVGNFGRYRQGDDVLFLARRSADVFASRRGDTITVLDGGKRLRVQTGTGEPRVGERVELYREEEVRFGNGNVRLAGTLLLPPGPGPHPAVVFAEGAGRTTRHGFGRIFADHFARQGIAALVYDKRGAGESTGRYGGVIRDYGALASDLLAGVRMLRSRPDIDASRVGVRGTSEGGWVVALAAARSSDIAFVMGISAPGRPGPTGVWEMQNKLRDVGVAEDALAAMALASTQVVPVARFLGLLPECCRDASFPEPQWERVRQPVLLIYGELDKLVPPAVSTLSITNALRRGGNQGYAVRAFPQANHAIAVAKTGFESEMRSAAAVRFAPGYMDAMVEWVRARLADAPPPLNHGWAPRRLEALRDIDDPPWHASPVVQLSLWAVFLSVFATTCAAPTLRRLLRRPREAPFDPTVAHARRLAVVVSAAYLAVAAGLVAVLALFGAGEPLRWLWTALRALALASAAMAVALVVITMRTWSRQWITGARRHHLSVTVAAAAFVPFLAYWHLLA